MRLIFAKRERAYGHLVAQCQTRHFEVAEASSMSGLSTVLTKPAQALLIDADFSGDRLLPILEMIRAGHADLPVLVLQSSTSPVFVPVAAFAPAMVLESTWSSGEIITRIEQFVQSDAESDVVAPMGERPHVRLDELPSAQRHQPMKRAVGLLHNVADSDVTVLIAGESGVGKELFARTLHARSLRRNKPFIDINCAALPGALLEAELFGAERGAYTGSLQRRIGKFELAQRGTIFLDEVSEMDLALQAKLLRVIQEKELYRVGGERKIALDVRVVATTNRDLREWVARGKFRQDLYYRLNVIGIHVPPLRERKEDIPILVQHILERFNREHRKEVLLTPGAMEQLCRHSWGGNIRELENTLFLSAFLTPGRKIDKIHFDEAMPMAAQQASFAGFQVNDEPRATHAQLSGTLEEMERVMIRQALVQHSGNRTHAACALGISVRTLRNKLRLYPDLDPRAAQQ